MPTVNRLGRREREQRRSHRCAHVVAALALRPVHSVGPTVQAGGHLEGLDELSGTHSTGALRHQASEPHLPAQVDLKTQPHNTSGRKHSHAYAQSSVRPDKFKVDQQTITGSFWVSEVL